MPFPILAAAQAGSALLSGVSSILKGNQAAELAKQRGEAMSQYYKDQARFVKIRESRKATAQIGAGQADASERGIDFSGSALEATFNEAFNTQFEAAFQRSQLRQQARIAKFDALVDAQNARLEGFDKAISSATSAGFSIAKGVKK